MIYSLGMSILDMYLLSNGQLAVLGGGHSGAYGIFVIEPEPLAEKPQEIRVWDMEHDVDSLRYILEHPEVVQFCMGHPNENPSEPIRMRS